MEELYWITRLGALNFLFNAIIFVSLVAIIILGVELLVIKTTSDNEDDKNLELQVVTGKVHNENMFYNFVKKQFIRAFIAFVVSIVCNVFIPTKNEALMIYGVGGTIDYIKSNETAKQLPDKYIKALDKYLDNINKEEEEQNDNESK